MSWYADIKKKTDYDKVLIDEIENLAFRMTAVQTQLLKVQKAIAIMSGEPGGMTELEKKCWSVYEKGPPHKFYLTIPVAPPRLEIHWQNWPQANNRSEVREAWYNFVKAAWDKAAWGWRENLPRRPIESFIAAFRFNYGDEIKRDVDNYAIKFIIDALSRCSIIAGDDSNRMSLFITARYGGEWRTEVLIYETPEINYLPPDLMDEIDRMEKQAENEYKKAGMKRPENNISGNSNDWI